MKGEYEREGEPNRICKLVGFDAFSVELFNDSVCRWFSTFERTKRVEGKRGREIKLGQSEL